MTRENNLWNANNNNSSTYICFHSLSCTIKKIIAEFSTSDVVLLYGYAGVGKTSLCKYMISTKSLCDIYNNVLYVYEQNIESLSTHNTLIIWDGADEYILKNIKKALYLTKHLSQDNKILIVSREFPKVFMRKYPSIEMPNLSTEELVRIIKTSNKNKNISLNKDEYELLGLLSGGSPLNGQIIAHLLSEEQFKTALKKIEKINGVKIEPRTWSILAYIIGVGEERNSKYSEAEYLYKYAYEKALDAKKTFKRDNEFIINILLSISSVLIKQDKNTSAIEYLVLALNRAEKPLQRVTIHIYISDINYQMREYISALNNLQKALSILQQSALSDESFVRQLYSNILLRQARIYECIKQYDNALSIYTSLLTKESIPLIEEALIYNNIGTIYNNLHKYNEALESYYKALDIADVATSTEDYAVHSIKEAIVENLSQCQKSTNNNEVK